jgi:hypothetical protein
MRYVRDPGNSRAWELTEYAIQVNAWERFVFACDKTFDNVLWNDIVENVVVEIHPDGDCQSRQIKPWMDLKFKELMFPVEGKMSREEFWQRQANEQTLYLLLDKFVEWLNSSYEA